MITTEIIDFVAHVCLENPPVNALTPTLLDGIAAELEELELNPSVKVVVIRSALKNFGAGADLAAFSEMDDPQVFLDAFHNCFNRVEDLALPVIAAVRGYAIGGSCELALACDLRVLSASATLSLPEVTLGLIPGAGGTYRAARIAGIGMAKEMILTGSRITAERALGTGLAQAILPEDDFVTAVQKYASVLTKSPTDALANAKSAIDGGFGRTRASALVTEQEAFRRCFKDEQTKRIVAEFLDKCAK